MENVCQRQKNLFCFRDQVAYARQIDGIIQETNHSDWHRLSAPGVSWANFNTYKVIFNWQPFMNKVYGRSLIKTKTADELFVTQIEIFCLAFEAL